MCMIAFPTTFTADRLTIFEAHARLQEIQAKLKGSQSMRDRYTLEPRPSSTAVPAAGRTFAADGYTLVSLTPISETVSSSYLLSVNPHVGFAAVESVTSDARQLHEYQVFERVVDGPDGASFDARTSTGMQVALTVLFDTGESSTTAHWRSFRTELHVLRRLQAVRHRSIPRWAMRCLYW